MARENVEIVRSIFEAWSRGDFSSADWAHPDIVFVPGIGPSVKGLEAMARTWSEFLEPWEGYSVEPLEIVDAGDDRVLLTLRFHGRGRRSGASIDAFQGANIFTIRDGLVVRLELVSDAREARRMVGLD